MTDMFNHVVTQSQKTSLMSRLLLGMAQAHNNDIYKVKNMEDIYQMALLLQKKLICIVTSFHVGHSPQTYPCSDS